MKCPACQTENPENRKFCRECGTRLVLLCPACKVENLPGDKFCGGCGQDLRRLNETKVLIYDQPRSYTPKHLADKILSSRSSIEGERKVITILFADVVNSTAMFENLDPESVHEIMDGCFRLLMDETHRYEGTINQFRGDGIMALFGAPIAHEDHAQRACRAALSMQSAIKQYSENLKDQHRINFAMRIGINSGAVVVGSIGDDLRMDYTAQGDTANLAARMESSAAPGSVLLSHNTYRLVRDYFHVKPLGKIEIKGKIEPQEVFELIKAGGAATRIEAATAKGLTKFLGRENFMSALMGAFEKAKNGTGQVVGIVGEAGVGKSRIVLEFRSRLPKEEARCLEGRCVQYGAAMSYLPILDILRSYLGIEEGEHEHLIRTKIEEKLLRLDERLKTSLHPIYELLSLNIEDPSYLQLDPEEKSQRTFEALRDLFIRLSKEKTLILALEDLHWVDRLTEQFIDHLIGWLPNARILLIIIHRPEYVHQWGSKSYWVGIGLNPLSLKSSAELVHSILGDSHVSPELSELVLSRAGGNPLFVEELIRSLVENGSIHLQDDNYILGVKASEIPVPVSIQGVIAARIDRVEENAKRIMQSASVIGREFAFRILQTISDVTKDLNAHLIDLQRLEFIYEKNLFPELEYIFKHALTQEVVYNSILVKRRKKIHGNIAEAIESLYVDRLPEFYEALAYHHGRSDNGEKAVDYLYRAVQRAFSLNALDQAKTYFDEAMRFLDGLSDTTTNNRRRIVLLTESRGQLFQQLFRVQEFADLLKQYHPTAIGLGDSQLQGCFLGCMGFCQWWFGELDNAVSTLLRAVETLESNGQIKEIGYCHHWLQWCYVMKGEMDRAIALKSRILGRLDKSSQLFPYVYSLSSTIYAHAFLGQWDQAEEDGQRAIKAAEEFSNNSMVSFVAINLSIAEILKGDLPRAVEYAEMASQKASTLANRVWAQSTLVWAQGKAQGPLMALQVFSTIAPLFRASGFAFAAVLMSIGLGELSWLAGQYDEANKFLRECLDLSDRYGAKYFAAWAHRLLGEVALKQESSNASFHFEQSMSIADEIRSENELALACAGYGRFLRKIGRITEAREYMIKALNILCRVNTPVEQDKIQREIAELPSG
jgi:class 3 adenylate cyclase/tetratricopeptide (TPR) repeat protein